jgi:hypothetical protein
MSKLNKKQLKETVVVIAILIVCLMADSIVDKIVNLIF